MPFDLDSRGQKIAKLKVLYMCENNLQPTLQPSLQGFLPVFVLSSVENLPFGVQSKKY